MAYLVRDARARSPSYTATFLSAAQAVSGGGLGGRQKGKEVRGQGSLGRSAKTADSAAAGNLDQARSREIVLETVERITGDRRHTQLKNARNGVEINGSKNGPATPTLRCHKFQLTNCTAIRS